MRIQAAGVRQDPHFCPGQWLVLRSDDRARPLEGGSVGSDPKHREPADTELADKGSKFGRPSLELSGIQLVGPSGGAGNDVGDTQAVGQQQVLLCWG